MPNNIRWILSVVVALATAAAAYYESQSGQGFLMWFALGLGAVLIGAVWLFPEAKERDSAQN